MLVILQIAIHIEITFPLARTIAIITLVFDNRGRVMSTQPSTGKWTVQTVREEPICQNTMSLAVTVSYVRVHCFR